MFRCIAYQKHKHFELDCFLPERKPVGILQSDASIPFSQAHPIHMEWMLDAVSDGIAWIDQEAYVQWCNATFAELFEAPREKIIGKDLSALFPSVQLVSVPPHSSPCSIDTVLQAQASGSGIYSIERSNQQMLVHLSWQWSQPSPGEAGHIVIARKKSEWVQPDPQARVRSHGRPAPSKLDEYAMADYLQDKYLDDPGEAKLGKWVHTLENPNSANPTSANPTPENSYDALTGLFNRSLFLHRLVQLIHLGQETKSDPFQVLCFDLDRFKIINDSLGHAIGDRLLREVANRVAPLLNPTDTFARLVGDEFGILLEGKHSDTRAVELAHAIQAKLKEPVNLDDQVLFITVSIGLITDSSTYQRAEDLMQDVDTAMYRAKSAGLGNQSVFCPEMREQLKEQLELEMDIRRAADYREFSVHYQPLISLKTGYITGFEALLRWDHPKKGLISPSQFIPIAEETGLIIPLGLWALREACQQLQVWQQTFPMIPPLSISVNLSAKQFSQPDLVSQISQILTDIALEPLSLCLEITESTVMENVEAAIEMLHELKAQDIRLSIDDFGTGYSSLGYLHRFPVDTLKLDRSFIHNIDTDAEKIEIIQTVVTLAWNIGLDVVAEGVETSTQLAQLKALRCEKAQGFFFSPPMDAAAATAFLADRQPGNLKNLKIW